jgi:hypothetical protein
MSSIDEISSKIKRKKMTLDQYKPLSGFEVETSAHQNANTSKHYSSESLSTLNNSTANKDTFEGEKAYDLSSSEKASKRKRQIKTTVYFSEKSRRQFDEIYAKRILNFHATEKTDILAEAIELLYQKEIFAES